jgi:hypothetical protein
MPVASGGREVDSAIQTPQIQLPISIDQTAIEAPAFNSPGNISAPKETIFAIRTTAATVPATASLKPSRPIAIQRDGDFFAVAERTANEPTATFVSDIAQSPFGRRSCQHGQGTFLKDDTSAARMITTLAAGTIVI